MMECDSKQSFRLTRHYISLLSSCKILMACLANKFFIADILVLSPSDEYQTIHFFSTIIKLLSIIIRLG